MTNWYKIENIEQIDSPALLVYPDRIAKNIELTKALIAGDCDKLRPHVKTNKMAEVCQMMLDAGINKFKCATIAEAEMLGVCKAPDVLLAYQPVGPKIERLIRLVKAYPATRYSCLIDNINTAKEISALCIKESVNLPIYIDVNVGMGRTGIPPELAPPILAEIQKIKGIYIVGLHGYDGHIHDSDLEKRTRASDKSYALVKELCDKIQVLFSDPLKIVMGGSPSFPMHAKRENVECSPGTFVFWDYGYSQMMLEVAYDYAAVLISRVISIVDKNHICIDLGHKSVAAENPLPRVYFLNDYKVKPIAQSEEHLVLEVDDSKNYRVGDVFYGIPKHICPTVALYERVFVVKDSKVITHWNVIARDRKINY